MSQNSFIKQYLAKQQELLRQRLERESREVYDTNGKCFSDSQWLQSELLYSILSFFVVNRTRGPQRGE